MKQRISQFAHALVAHMGADDKAFVAKYLNAEEQEIFYAMHRVDQVHAVHVAHTAQRLAAENLQAGKIQDVAATAPKETKQQAGTDTALSTVNLRLLTRCALLHDVGRVKGDLDLMGKVWAVLLAHYLPDWSRRMADFGRIHFLYVYYHHALLGATKLYAHGLRTEAQIIARHHAPARPGDSVELQLLRAADALN